MKNILTFWMFIFPFSLFAQVGMKNMSLKHPDSALLYIGAQNFIEISGLDNYTNLELKSSSGTVNPFEDGKFHLLVRRQGPDTVLLFRNHKLIFTKIYSIKYIPDAKSQLGYITEKTATVNQILQNTKLYVVLPGCDYKHNFRIRSFELILIDPKNILLQNSGPTRGNELNSIHLEEIKKLKPGSRLVFENIKATCPYCAGWTLNTLTITIK